MKNGLKILFAALLAALLISGGAEKKAYAGNPACTIEGVDDYPSISDALEYVQTSMSGTGTIKLLRDVTECFSIAADLKIVLDLDGHVLTSTDYEMPVIIASGELTIKDSSPDSTHTGSTLPAGGVITGGFRGVAVSGTLEMTGGTITGNNCTDSSGGGVYVFNGGKFTMTGGTITGNTAENGGGVYVGSTFTMKGGTIDRNTASSYGGGLYNVGVFTMEGGTISGNTAKTGGGVQNRANSTFNMTGGSITNCSSTIGPGGGVNNQGAFTVGGSAKVSGNKMGENANNVYLPNGKVIAISADKALSGDASIGVNTATAPTESSPVTISGASDTDYSRYFHSDTEGYEVVYNTTGKVVQLQVKAADNTFKALNGLITGDTTGTITLDKDYTYAGSGDDTTITISKDITLDLNGYKIDGGNANGNSVITVAAGATLTLIDRSAAQTGTITGGQGSNGPCGGGVLNYGTFIMEGGTITGNTVGRSGGGVCNAGTFTMTGGAITGNTATSYYGGGVNNEGTFTMEGGTISGNTAKTGGGVYNTSTGKFDMTGGAITGNTATGAGGGVYVYASSTFNMKGGAITGNTASKYGGGVYNAGNFTMKGGTISGNTADSGGVHNRAAFTMEGGEISGNTASNLGGGVDNYGGTFNMTGGEICNNKAVNGGGVQNRANSTFNMTGGSITNCSSTIGPGGGVNNQGAFTVGGSAQITGNKKGENANNVFLPNGKVIAISADKTLSGASIGVTAATAPTSTAAVSVTGTATETDLACFTSDSTDYAIVYNTDHLELTLPAAELTTKPAANTALTYTGEPQALVTAGEATGGTVQYSLDGTTWSETLPTGTDAGDYSVYAKVAGDASHLDSEVTGPIDVTIAALEYAYEDETETLTYTKESGQTVTFICEGPFAEFETFLVDDEAVDAANYTAAEGSTEVTLKNSYLDTLSVGDHTVKFQYKNGASVEGKLTVKAKAVTPTGGGSGTGGSGGIPDTGDSATPALWAVVCLLSLTGLGLTALRKKRAK